MQETIDKQATVGEKLYRAYTENRAELMAEIQATRPELAPDDALAASQKLLDRILFIAFAEDRQILSDRDLLSRTAQSRRPGSTLWRAFQDLFRALDEGDEFMGVPRFNGALFKPDPLLDDPRFRLDDDRWPAFFESIGDYDFRDEVSVDVLGRIFERSIPDVEAIRERGLDAFRDEVRALPPIEEVKEKGRRHREGVYYTDRAVTSYLVAAALDPAWEANRVELLARHGLPDDQALDPDPTGADDDATPPDPALAGYVRDRLRALDAMTVCDPACGSGAFLIAAYDWFEARRLALLDDLQRAEPTATEADGDRDDWKARSAPLILANNIYGVDLSPESVEIARLSLWIRTARRGQALSDLTTRVVAGNSVVDDPALDAPAPVPLARAVPRRLRGRGLRRRRRQPALCPPGVAGRPQAAPLRPIPVVSRDGRPICLLL